MLEIKNVTKKYGKFTAVDNLSLHIQKGEIYGFVGPNGAGKTTMFKMISTLLKPTNGNILINGFNTNNDLKKIRSTIGYMPDFFGVYDDLKVSEYLDFYGDVEGVEKGQRNNTIDDLLELVNLTEKKDSYVDSLSRGMKQRLCLARSLIHNPELLILDEPASGLDPRARFQMKEILKELKNMGKTIIISSHILPELSELCTSIGIIERGKIVISGTKEEIMSKIYNNSAFDIKVINGTENAVKLLKEQPLVKNIYQDENQISFDFDGEETEIPTLLKSLLNSGISVISFAQAESNLEDIFMKVTRGDEN